MGRTRAAGRNDHSAFRARACFGRLDHDAGAGAGPRPTSCWRRRSSGWRAARLFGCGGRDDEPDRLRLRAAPLRPGSGVQALAPEPGDGEPSPAGRQPTDSATPEAGANRARCRAPRWCSASGRCWRTAPFTARAIARSGRGCVMPACAPARRRVLRVMRDHGLLAHQRPGSPRGPPRRKHASGMTRP